jgi:hypothetical protein
VQTALVAAHRCHYVRSTERGPAFFRFVAKAVAVDLCCFFSAHIDIVVGHHRRKKARLKAGQHRLEPVSSSDLSMSCPDEI